MVFLSFLALFIVVSLIVPWVNCFSIKGLREEIQSLQNKVRQLHQIIEKNKIDASPIRESQPIVTPTEQLSETLPPRIGIKIKNEPIIVPETSQPSFNLNLEKQFGARLPIWFGGIALALAGFFLVKYSIEKGLLSPAIRVCLGGLFGIILLVAAKYIREKSSFANIRIPQSLSGAGIAVLYATFYAATGLYQLIPSFLSFAGMAATTGLAIFLSLRHGAPIALLGLIGGFLTPALVGATEPSSSILLTYLLIVFFGLMFIIKRQSWWYLAIPALLACFVWVGFVMLGGLSADMIRLSIFLLAISGVFIFFSKKEYETVTTNLTEEYGLLTLLNYIGLGCAIILMGYVSSLGDFGLMQWCLFAVLAIGGIILAYFNEKLYGFVPLATLAVNAVMFLAWHPSIYYGHYAITLAVFSTLYIGSGYLLMWQARLPILWASLISATSIGYYLIAYFKLHNKALFAGIPFLWGMTAFAFSIMAVYTALKIQQRFKEHPHKEALLAITCLTSTAFFSLAMTIEINQQFLPIAIAAQMLAVAWINTRTTIKVLRSITLGLGLVFLFLQLPEIVRLLEIITQSLFNLDLEHPFNTLSSISSPFFQLGLPGAFFLGSSFFLRKQKDDYLVRSFEMAGVALITLMGYYLIRAAFHQGALTFLHTKAHLLERGVITNMLFLVALSCFGVNRFFSRVAFSWCAIALLSIALFRLTYFDLLIHNPLFNNQKILGVFLFNSLLLPFGLPIIWTKYASDELIRVGKKSWVKYCKGLMLIMAFTLINMNVRFLFHGEYLDQGITNNAEIYAYSVAWLLLGIGLLIAGIIKKDKLLRFSSLGVMVITVAKVFLFDAATLEGLYRVLSFLGLGLSLLGLSYFYTRFVFKEKLNP